MTDAFATMITAAFLAHCALVYAIVRLFAIEKASEPPPPVTTWAYTHPQTTYTNGTGPAAPFTGDPDDPA